MSGNARRRHRGPSRGRWLPVIVPVLLGAALGAAGVAAVTSVSGSTAPPPPAPSTTASSTTTQRPAETVPAIAPVAFAARATDATGMSLTVLRPEKVKGGVRLTVALANATDAPIDVDTGELGPHDQSFNGATVPITMTPAKKKIMPGEGYTYQCVIKLPTMDVGQLTLKVGTVTVAGQVAGD